MAASDEALDGAAHAADVSSLETKVAEAAELLLARFAADRERLMCLLFQ